MGTKVQSKSYLPGYHSMRDLNEGTSSSWPVYYEDVTPSGQFYNGFTPRPVNGYPEYDKEVLKQTMLKHEAIFRKQVYELHRLYRIQKDLMDDLKKKELRNYPVQMGTSQSDSFSSQLPCNNIERIWKMPCSPVVNVSCHKPSVSGLDDIQYPLNLLNGSITQAGQTPTENGSSLKDGKSLGSRLGKFPRRMLDLQLPADAYIDSEDKEEIDNKNVAEQLFGVTDSVNRNCDLEPVNDVKLTLSTGESPSCREESQQSDSCLQNGPHARNLADLNEPIKEIHSDVAAVSVFTKFLGTTRHEEIQGHQVPMKSKQSFLGQPKDLLQDRHRDEGACSVFSHSDKEVKRQEWTFFKNEPGRTGSNVKSPTPSFYDEKLPTSSEPVQVKLKKHHEFPSSVSPNQNKCESWFREKRTHGIELSGISHPLVNTNYMVPAASPVPGPLSAVSCSDSANTPLLVSSWRKPTHGISHIPIAVQALPCFNGSALLNMQSRSSSTSIHSPGSSCDKWQYKGDLWLHPSFGSETSYPNGFHNDFRSESNDSSHLHFPSISFDKPNLNNGDNSAYENSEIHGHDKYFKGLRCMDVKSAKDMDLNLALPNGFHDDSGPQRNQVLCDVEGKNENSSGQMSWLKTNLTFSESVTAKQGVPQTQGYSQLMSNCAVAAQEFYRRRETGNGTSQDVLQDFPLTLRAKDTRIQRNEAPDTPSSKKILGFSILDRTQQTTMSSSFISCQEHSVTDDAKSSMKEGLLHTNSSCNIKLLDLEKQISTEHVMGKCVGNSIIGFRNQINLNDMATSMDQPKSSDIPSKDEAEVPPPLSIPSVAAKITSGIDLEGPISLLSDEHVLSMEESPRTILLAKPAEMPQGETEGPRETEILHEILARMAAEIMVTMSLDKCSRSDDIACRPSTPALADSLHWFADVVSSKDDLGSAVGVSRGEGDGDRGSSDESGMDYFESMTLKLTETKVEEYCCRPWGQENRKEDDIGISPPLLTRPRKGQARRRRQRRDFQKDILPGLSSLSRHEVTEDLQTIGGLMKASGQFWQIGITRRSVARNGQARGRRWPRGSTAVVVESQVDPPPLPRQPNNTELEIDGKSIMGWGRTTRRCRRQRCPLGNIPAPPLT